jgi:hypothetical protein
MSIFGYKLTIAFLGIMVLVLLGALWALAWQDTYATWDVRYARLALKRIERLRSMAVGAPPEKAVSYMRDISTCYSSVKWHRPSLRLAQLVEEERKSAIHDVIEYLRRTTGRDLGDSPMLWIAEYSITAP